MFYRKRDFYQKIREFYHFDRSILVFFIVIITFLIFGFLKKKLNEKKKLF